MKFSKGIALGAAALVAIMVVASLGGQTTFAQGGQPPSPQAIDFQAFNACSTANYADVVSKAFGMTAVDLRKALVSGQTLNEIATSKNITLQTVFTTIQATRKADIDQAVKDGVLTQDEATRFESAGNGTPPAPGGSQGTPGQGGQGGNGQGGGRGGGQGGPQGAPQGNQLPDINNMADQLGTAATQPAPGTGPRRGGGGGGFGFGGGFGGISFNLVRPWAVSAQALSMKCGDLVKTLLTTPGKSIAGLATDKQVVAQTLTDALTKAYTDALAQNVSDGVITQAQSDKLSANLNQAILNFINNPNPMRGGPRGTPQATQSQ